MSRALCFIKDLGLEYPTDKSNYKKRFGIYKCFCGNEFRANSQDIKNKKIKSCGCLKVVHGLKSHRLYHVWTDMIRRCSKLNDKSYKNYGARGITVCDRWLDVSNFIEDMYPTYQEGLTIDRIDVNGNYEPSNCRWATREVQNRNTQKLRSTNTSGYRGVSWDSRIKKYRCQISLSGNKIGLGSYLTALEAAKVYDKYVQEHNLEHTLNNVNN